MSEAVSSSIAIFLEGYPTIFVATIAFFIMIKLLMKSTSRRNEK
ncbi:MAG TPA: hypothetical protein PKN37_01525 [Mesotoga sp.]|jgi:hypothetical protein|nr:MULTISPECIES: hypothetical protein [unclassified Mesotoga]MDD3460050.1 hypothetical protein [Mesotoga sp.]HNS34881.1 hypothetical protein [Mesotoga sp.]HNU22913.1 hypothetical protein [Mesotoga sp.]